MGHCDCAKASCKLMGGHLGRTVCRKANPHPEVCGIFPVRTGPLAHHPRMMHIGGLVLFSVTDMFDIQ